MARLPKVTVEVLGAELIEERIRAIFQDLHDTGHFSSVRMVETKDEQYGAVLVYLKRPIFLETVTKSNGRPVETPP